LQWIKNYHDAAINYSLEDVQSAATILQVDHFNVPVITVAGTNGKGSCIATMEAILLAHDYQVAAYTSPHLFNFNERIRVNGSPVTELEICNAMQQVHDVIVQQQDLNLSLFEFVTMAALLIFKQKSPDIILLEVGLGGRLDAVNVVKNNVAIITSVALDHCAYLGDTLEAIGYEKAGILQPNSIGIYADAQMPHSVQDFATQHNIKLFRFGIDYFINDELPKVSFPLTNAAAGLYALSLLPQLQLQDATIKQALQILTVPGRMQVAHHKNLELIFDVAHNPAAVAWLVAQLQNRAPCTQTLVVLGVAASKDARGMLALWKIPVVTWYICEPESMRRATKAEVLTETISELQLGTVVVANSAAEALQLACNQAQLEQDRVRIVVFGSFHTVAQALQSYYRIIENDSIHVC
jgi:dihydrofolate synthase/folylpolyglutamate synthase